MENKFQWIIIQFLLAVFLIDRTRGYNDSHMSLTAVPLGIPNNEVMVDLSHNSISYVDTTPLKSLNSLQTLYLQHNNISVFPDPANISDTLVTLDLSHNIIPGINATKLSEYTMLSSLSLGNNNLGPAFVLPSMDSLTTINLDSNGMTHLTVEDNPSITYLSLSGNSLVNITINSTNNIATLDISSNGMSGFPNYLTIFPKLSHLKIGGNSFSSIAPARLTEIPELSKLDLTGSTNMESLTIINLTNLLEVNIVNSDLKYLTITNVWNLTKLYAQNSKLSAMPDFGSKETRLEILDVRNCNISSIPGDYFENKTSLQEVYLTGNNLDQFDGTHLDTLVTIDLSGNNFSLFPIVTDGLQGDLRNLYINNNKIPNITLESVFRGQSMLNQLDRFEFGGNPLLEFPTTVLAQMPNLTYLGIQDLDLNEIPDLSMVPSLTHLDIQNNNISSLTSQHLQQMPQLNTIKVWNNFVFLFYKFHLQTLFLIILIKP